jgi:hypothetical protein
VQRDRKGHKKGLETDSGNHIWNLVSQPLVAAFLQSSFPKLLESETISLVEFIIKALGHYTGLTPSSEEIYKMKEQL